MNLLENLKRFAFYQTFVFVCLYLIFFPIPFYILPEIGEWFHPFTSELTKSLALLLGMDNAFIPQLWSDSGGHYLFTAFIAIVAALTSSGLVIFTRHPIPQKLKVILHLLLSYFLAMILLKYGADKIFKHQFYLPEPNTLFTPVGKLSRDMLFWTSMGASYSYTVFGGIVEVIAGLLLLFRKTRLMGILMASGILLNVLMLNIGFDITVKLFSFILFSMSLVLLVPYLPALKNFLLRNHSVQYPDLSLKFNQPKQILTYAVIKSICLFLLFFESFGYYIQTENFNDDLAPRPFLHGAYDIYLFTDNGQIIPASMNNPGRFKRVFFHRRNYFVVQTMNDEFIDYKVEVDSLNQTMFLYDSGWPAHRNKTSELDFRLNENKLVIFGYFFDSYITLFSQKIDIQRIPLLNQTTHWTLESFKESGE